MKSHKTSQGPVPWSSTDSHLASVKHFVKKLVKTLGLEPEKQKTGFRPTCLGTEKPVWLVVSTPLKNIIQLGWWHSQYMEKNVPNHQPDNVFRIFKGIWPFSIAMLAYQRVYTHDIPIFGWKFANLSERPIPNENQWLRVFVASANRSWKIHSIIWKKIWNMDGTWMELDCLAQKDYQQLFLPCVGESNFFATRRKDRSLPRMKNQVWIMINNDG